jgi:hypothetical protein
VTLWEKSASGENSRNERPALLKTAKPASAEPWLREMQFIENNHLSLHIKGN